MQTVTEVVHLLAHRRDPRVRGHVMQSTPAGVGLALLGYLLLVGYGPRFMKNRSTPPLRLVMTLYNIGQVLLSSYMVREFWLSRPVDAGLCAPVQVTEDALSRRLLDACWLFHMSKIVDFLDTLFLVLKKDHKRMTYLHVYHHGSMVSGFWLGTLFAPGGSLWIPGFLNSGVHCVMYSYYLLASLGPRVRPYLWWKRYLTQLQLLQFGLIVAVAVIIQMPSMRCGLPLWTCTMTFTYLIVLSALFINFYVRAYLHTPPSSKRSAAVTPAVTPAVTSAVTPAVTSAMTSTMTSPAGQLANMASSLFSHGMGCYVKEE